MRAWKSRATAGARLAVAAVAVVAAVLGSATPMPAAVADAPAREPASAPSQASADDAAAEEERALRREQLEAAAGLWRDHPSGDAAFVLAMVHHEQGDVLSAIREWQEGLRLPPESVRLHRRAEVLAELGEALRIREQFEDAERAFRESLALQPRREPTLLRLGQLLYATDRAEECLAVLDAGGAASATACGLRGKSCQRLGRLEDARRHFEEALAKDPQMAEACYGLSVVCARLGAADQADAYRERFARLKAQQQTLGREYRASLNPLRTTRQSLAMTHTTVGWAYGDRGQTQLAERFWRRAAELDPANTACRFHLLMACQRAGRNDDALRMCEEMIRAEPDNPFHQISLGNVEGRLGRTAEAGRAYEAAHRLGPDRPETCFALAQFYLRTNTRLPEAARLAARAVALSPVAPHQYLLSRAAARTGDRSTAVAAAERACELDPRNQDYSQWRRALLSPP